MKFPKSLFLSSEIIILACSTLRSCPVRLSATPLAIEIGDFFTDFFPFPSDTDHDLASNTAKSLTSHRRS
jgi:hypothetical protein